MSLIKDYPKDVESSEFKEWLDDLTRAVRNLQREGGWAQFIDDTHDQSDPQILAAGVASQLVNNGASGEQGYLKDHTCYTPATGVLAGEPGYIHLLEVDFIGATVSSANTVYTVSLHRADNNALLHAHELSLTKGATTPTRFGFMTMCHMTTELQAAGGGKLWIECEDDAEVWGKGMTISHMYSPIY